MSSSLLLEAAELLPTDPRAAGPHLLLGYDLGEPELVTAAVEALLLDGERVHLARVGNRTFTLPIVVIGEDRDDLTARVDALLAQVTSDTFTLTWTPQDGLPLVWDCFPGQATVRWDVRVENAAFAQQVDLVIPALPYGRSPDLITPDLTLVQTETRGRLYTIGDCIGSARAPMAVQLDFAGAVEAWLIHRPPPDADPEAPILLELTSGEVTFADAEKLRGTYSVVLSVSTFDAPGQNRTVEVTFEQDGTTVTQTISRAYLSTLATKPLYVGNITLPLVDRPAGAVSSMTITVDDSGTSVYLGVMLLDTRGQTVQSLSQAPGTADTLAAWVDEPELGAAVGPVWNSPSGLRTGAYAATEPRVAGGPLVCSAADSGGALLIASSGAAAPSEPVLGYYPRWLAERVE